jgi:hypothetical protein
MNQMTTSQSPTQYKSTRVLYAGWKVYKEATYKPMQKDSRRKCTVCTEEEEV